VCERLWVVRVFERAGRITVVGIGVTGYRRDVIVGGAVTVSSSSILPIMPEIGSVCSGGFDFDRKDYREEGRNHESKRVGQHG
jgi:hypothetical protein